MGYQPFPPFGRLFNRAIGAVGVGNTPRWTVAMAALNPLLWLRFNEPSGTTVTNYGSLGSGENGTWTPGTGSLAQTGQLGAQEAYNYDGSNSLVTVAAHASLDTLAAATYLFVTNPNTAGESSNARFLEVNSDAEAYRINSVNLDLRMVVPGTGGINTITDIGFISLNAWSIVFFTYDFNGDKKGRIYKGSGSSVVEATYATQTAGSGTKTAEAFAKNVGNTGAQTRTFKGLIDEVAIFGTVLSLNQMAGLVCSLQAGIP